MFDFSGFRFHHIGLNFTKVKIQGLYDMLLLSVSESTNDHQLPVSDHYCPPACIVARQWAPKLRTLGITITSDHVIHHINPLIWSRNRLNMNCIINTPDCQEDFTEDSAVPCILQTKSPCSYKKKCARTRTWEVRGTIVLKFHKKKI